MRVKTYNIFMKINVKHVAKLANLPLSDEEEKSLRNNFRNTYYIEQLNSVDTKMLK